MMSQSPTVSFDDWVTLNVGGQCFLTTKSTLCSSKNSIFAKIFETNAEISWNTKRDANGAYLFDRSSHYFEPVLNYLRTARLVLDDGVSLDGVLEEAKFYNIESLIEVVEKMIQERRDSANDSGALTRQDVVDVLMRSHLLPAELRFQGVNLRKADLSCLDLRHINFKYANLSECDLSQASLSFSNFERANLSHAKLDGAQLHGAKMLCANLEYVSARHCNLEDPTGHKTILEGANLKHAVLEGSQMAGCNLRIAKLKSANLRNCDLRGACLAGADLEQCDLSQSDLHEANLRGANFTGTILEAMTTPLHMSQCT